MPSDGRGLGGVGTTKGVQANTYMKWLIEIFYNLSIRRAERSTKNELRVQE